jgi:asparagine synthase (glutamine-hydrolysing)
MCGIAGFIAGADIDLYGVIDAMTSSLKHRGPDSRGVWVDAEKRIALGHTRLSILDLSETGSQPMVSASGRYIIAFNGEIYNHLAIRKSLDQTATQWNGTSDTETLLEAIERWGVENTIELCVGMFAIALWDCQEERLTLIRDRMGEKPLYYSHIGGHIVFASELVAFRQCPLINCSVDRSSLALYLQYSSVPEPYSIYKDVCKLESGQAITFSLKTNQSSKLQYWSTCSIANVADSAASPDNDEAATNQLENHLLAAVRGQMHADVPLGAFLSGGIDSSLIVALMQAQSAQKVKTFTIGFEDKAYDESPFAREIAQHLGTEHHEVVISEKQLLDIVPLIPKIYSEPFSESSQIPTFLVSQTARKHVTVALSGDAGDELFCGYSRYQWANNTWRYMSHLPSGVRAALYHTANKIPFAVWRMLLCPLRVAGRKTNYPDKLMKGIQLLRWRSRQELYAKGFMSHNSDALEWVAGSTAYSTFLDVHKSTSDSYFDEMQLCDLMTYLPNNNLAKMDRAAMFNGLETRVPFLDHRVVQYALGLPLRYRYRDGTGKWILRQVLYRYVPKEMIERPKMGFAVPLAAWTRGPLRAWCEALLDESRLRNDGFFDAQIIRRKWAEHLSGRRNWQGQLWNIIIFNAWLDEQQKTT